MVSDLILINYQDINQIMYHKLLTNIYQKIFLAYIKVINK